MGIVCGLISWGYWCVCVAVSSWVIIDNSLDMFRASTIDNKSYILLHLFGILSSRFAHDARSQEHKEY